ncbi:MAG: class I SAM-dependent rRNA methyltransferase, partial [Bacteroidota bacterium]
KNEEKRLLSGHQWIFSNEIKTVLGDPEPGDIVELLRHDNKFLGIGFYNPNSLIAFRLLTTEREEIGFPFFERRIAQAFHLRQRLFPDSGTYRLVHGEGDFLPGLVIDRYNEYIAVQTFSFGMDRRLTLICDVLESLFHPRAIIERNESPLRTLEKLDQRKQVLRGTLDQTIITENGVKFKVDLLAGQKTGTFLDQRENRIAVRRYVKGTAVLDGFCNEGGFTLHAAASGAASVHAVDVSEAAIARAKVNATINQVNSIDFRVGDAFAALQSHATAQKQFDVVMLDPPSFTRTKKTIATALRAYRELHGLALGMITPGGFLVTSSCSHHISQEAFFSTVEAAARTRGRRIQLLESAGAGPAHATVTAMPETSYQKFGIIGVQ